MPREDRSPRLAPLRGVVHALTIAGAYAAAAAISAEGTYAPTLRDAYPDTVYWGDTHVHTYLSGDAFGLGTRATPEEAYRFAKGEEVVSTGGKPASPTSTTQRLNARKPLIFRSRKP